ncbi:MAG: NAD(P)-dependent oxidoreductase [Armatimonas sp.]
MANSPERASVKLLHLAQTGANASLFRPAFRAALEPLGILECIENAQALSTTERLEKIRSCDVLLTAWGSLPVPEELATDTGQLGYICHLTGELRHTVPLSLIQAGIPVTNWGAAPANRVAEGAMALLLACLKNLHDHIQAKQAGEWVPASVSWSGTLSGMRLGVYGYGIIGRRFCELAAPFGPTILVFDPFVTECPYSQAGSLDDLFANSDAISLHAGLTPETKGAIGPAQLALLPDHGIIVNTARGGLIDQNALFAELELGRLRAGLDVLDGDDRLPIDHPARHWPNLILTAHRVEQNEWPPAEDGLLELHRVALENLRRFAKKEPLQFLMTEQRYELST